jgi:hypothetical protein
VQASAGELLYLALVRTEVARVLLCLMPIGRREKIEVVQNLWEVVQAGAGDLPYLEPVSIEAVKVLPCLMSVVIRRKEKTGIVPSPLRDGASEHWGSALPGACEHRSHERTSVPVVRHNPEKGEDRECAESLRDGASEHWACALPGVREHRDRDGYAVPDSRHCPMRGEDRDCAEALGHGASGHRGFALPGARGGAAVPDARCHSEKGEEMRPPGANKSLILTTFDVREPELRCCYPP